MGNGNTPYIPTAYGIFSLSYGGYRGKIPTPPLKGEKSSLTSRKQKRNACHNRVVTEVVTVEVSPMAYEHSTHEQQKRMEEIMDRDRAKRKGYWLMPDGVLTFIETEPARVQEEKGGAAGIRGAQITLQRSRTKPRD